MTTVTSVICAYWPSRFSSIPLIVENLLGGTVVPDHILVINNNPDHKMGDIAGAHVINSGRNFTSRSKYAIALLEPSDYYLLLDDDISVRPGCLKALLGYAYSGCCFSDWGMKMVSNFISEATWVTGPAITEPQPVDAFFGIMQFVSFEAIIHMLEAEAKIRLPDLPRFRSIGEDLLIAMSNDAKIVPLAGDDNLISMPLGSGSMQWDYGYARVREIFAYRTWLALGRTPFPGNNPDDASADSDIASYLNLLDNRDKGTISKVNRGEGIERP